MKLERLLWVLKVVLGCALFALGFDLFLEPNSLNAGGISGLAMILVHLLKFGSVGTISMVVNLPLLALGGMKVSKKFMVGSLVGILANSVLLDLFTLIPVPEVEPLMAALYGSVLVGVGLGLVFLCGASTGGSDIIVRLLKLRFQNVPIGTITFAFDLMVVVLTGLTFADISRALYSGVVIFITGQVIDAMVYRFDYSKVALIVSSEYEAITQKIQQELERGVTYLNGEGSYSHRSTKVILTAVKKQQLAELKRMVSEIDPNAFVIVQEAHQVLGDGFSHYSKDSL